VQCRRRSQPISGRLLVLHTRVGEIPSRGQEVAMKELTMERGQRVEVVKGQSVTFLVILT